MPTYTDLLIPLIEDTCRVSDGLMTMVKDEDLGWKPASGRNWMTAGQLLLHMTTACGFCCQGFLTGDWGMPEDFDPSTAQEEDMLPPAERLPAIGSVAEAREALARDRELALRMVAQAGEADLAGKEVVPPWAADQAPRPLGQHFLEMVLHLNQHKGQLFYYLKLMGRDVNTMHLWGV
jgi:uncharacterized damage-inducible protein DinB